jgi:hypothetical protein
MKSRTRQVEGQEAVCQGAKAQHLGADVVRELCNLRAGRINRLKSPARAAASAAMLQFVADIDMLRCFEVCFTPMAGYWSVVFVA